MFVNKHSVKIISSVITFFSRQFSRYLNSVVVEAMYRAIGLFWWRTESRVEC